MGKVFVDEGFSQEHVYSAVTPSISLDFSGDSLIVGTPYYDSVLNDTGSFSVFDIVSEEPVDGCVEEWFCSDWSVCLNGVQNRNCFDLRNCGSEINLPTLSQACSPISPPNSPSGPGSTRGSSSSSSSSPGISKQDVSECVSNWTNCYWTECKNNFSHFECFDINRCEEEISKFFDTKGCGVVDKDSSSEDVDDSSLNKENSSGEDKKSRSDFALYSIISILVVLLLVVVSLIIYFLYKNRSSDSSEEKKDSVTKAMSSPLYPYLLENIDKYPLDALKNKAISGGYSEKEFDEIVRFLRGK